MPPSGNFWWTWAVKGTGAIEKALNDLLDERYPVTPFAIDALTDMIARLTEIRDRMVELHKASK